jgi:hypothetical protein
MESPQKSAKRSFRFHFIFLLLYIGTIVAMLEGLTILLAPKNPRMPHPILNHVWRPNYSWKEADCSKHINRQGWLEGYDIELSKPKDTFRIFYLGDSFTAGSCRVAVPDLVEVWLNQSAFARSNRFEVINAGTSSYSPVLYLLQVKNYVLQYSPDLLVVNIDMTDVFDDYICRNIGIKDSAGEMIAVPMGSALRKNFLRTRAGLVEKSFLRKMLDNLRDYSHLADLLMNNYEAMEERRQSESAPGNTSGDSPRPFDWCLPQWSAKTLQDVEFSMKTLRSLLQLARSSHVKVLVTAVPHLKHFLGEYSLRPFEEISRVCREEGVPYLDSYGPLAQRMGETGPSSYYLSADMHFNDDGYRLWAAVHQEFLADPENDLLPKPPLLLGPPATKQHRSS